MSVFNVFHIAGSALTAQSMRLNAVASNMANADSIAGPDGKPYRAKQVVFEATPMGGQAAQGVRVKQGYVMMPNVSVVDEMVNMISASRSYQTNAEVMNTAKQLLLKTLTLGQ